MKQIYLTRDEQLLVASVLSSVTKHLKIEEDGKLRDDGDIVIECSLEDYKTVVNAFSKLSHNLSEETNKIHTVMKSEDKKFRSVYSESHDELDIVSEKDYTDATTSSDVLVVNGKELKDGEKVIVSYKGDSKLCTVSNNGRSLSVEYNRSQNCAPGSRYQHVEDLEHYSLYIDLVESISRASDYSLNEFN